MDIGLIVDLLIIAVTLGAIYAIMALGLTFVYGITKVFNYAQGSFFTWSAYTAWYFYEKQHFNYGLCMALAIVFMAFVGLIFERGIVRPTMRRAKEWGLTALIVTLGAALFMDSATLVVFGPARRILPYIVEGNYQIGNITVGKHETIVVVIAVCIVIGFSIFLWRFYEGMAMRAVSQDAAGARIVGIPSTRIYALSFVITAILGAVSGLLLAPRMLLYPLVGWEVLIKAFVVVVVGGLGSIKGTLYGAFILAIVEVFVTHSLGAVWALPVFLVLLMILLIFKPKGLYGTW